MTTGDANVRAGELLACLFCGNAARVSLDTHSSPPRTAIGCSKCIICTEWTTEDEAVAAWNTRTTDPRLAMFDELVAALRSIGSLSDDAYAGSCQKIARAALARVRAIGGEGVREQKSGSEFFRYSEPRGAGHFGLPGQIIQGWVTVDDKGKIIKGWHETVVRDSLSGESYFGRDEVLAMHAREIAYNDQERAG